MLFTRRADGTLLVELTGKQFTEMWRQAPHAHRLVMDDRRPAVRKVEEDGITLYTIHAMLWEILRDLPRGQAKVQNRVVRCDACGSDMTVAREYDGGGKSAGCWCFKCPKCASTEIWSKEILGGTKGAGEKETL